MKRYLIPAVLAVSALAATSASAATNWVKSGVHLNVRSGPSTYHDVVGSLSPCSGIDVYKWENDWAQILYEGQYYWVSGGYLQDQICYYTPPPPPTYTAPKPTYTPTPAYTPPKPKY